MTTLRIEHIRPVEEAVCKMKRFFFICRQSSGKTNIAIIVSYITWLEKVKRLISKDVERFCWISVLNVQYKDRLAFYSYRLSDKNRNRLMGQTASAFRKTAY